MKKKLIKSLALVVLILSLVSSATYAFFRDREVSRGNKFKVGKLNLKVDNTCHYNGKVCTKVNDIYLWEGTDEECFCSWEKKNLSGELFFNLLDIKPGDYGEDTISLHIDNNPAWVCAEVSNLKNDDNGCDNPESDEDTTCGENEGELKDNLLFTVWKDADCDNVLDEEVLGTPAVFGCREAENPEADACRGSATLEDCMIYAQYGCRWIEIAPKVEAVFGEEVLVQDQSVQNLLWPIADSTTGSGPLSKNSDYCLGVSWKVPLETGNIIQSDSLVGDVIFTAVQSRHMDNFKCSDLTGEILPPISCAPNCAGLVCGDGGCGD